MRWRLLATAATSSPWSSASSSGGRVKGGVVRSADDRREADVRREGVWGLASGRGFARRAPGPKGNSNLHLVGTRVRRRGPGGRGAEGEPERGPRPPPRAHRVRSHEPHPEQLGPAARGDRCAERVHARGGDPAEREHGGCRGVEAPRPTERHDLPGTGGGRHDTQRSPPLRGHRRTGIRVKLRHRRSWPRSNGSRDGLSRAFGGDSEVMHLRD